MFSHVSAHKTNSNSIINNNSINKIITHSIIKDEFISSKDSSQDIKENSNDSISDRNSRINSNSQNQQQLLDYYNELKQLSIKQKELESHFKRLSMNNSNSYESQNK